MSNSFEFGEIFGLESPLTINATNTENIGFYKGPIDFETLVEDIKASKAKHTLKSFDYTKYVSTITETIETQDRETLEIHSFDRYVNIPFRVKDENNIERNLRLYGTLNKKIADVRTDIHIARTTIDAKKHRLVYKILFVYEGFGNKKNSTDKADVHRVAIAISTVTYEDYSAAFDYLGYHRGQVEQEVKEKFDEAFVLAEKSPSQLSFLYRVAPVFVLQNRSEALKWRDLEFLLEGRLPENREKAVLKIIRSLTTNFSAADESIETIKASSKSRINNFFYKISLKRMGGSLFEKLYLKINDFGIGEENFTLFIQELYLLWLLSDYSDPEYVKSLKEYTGGPEVILYDTDKILGFYNNDYNFDFVGDKFKLKIKVTREDTTYSKSSTHSNRPRSKTTIVDMGTYNLFHPITLADVPEEGEIDIPTNVIPAFYLKAFDDKQRWSNINKGVWLGVDIATTVTGFGNLMKLRHLRHLAKLRVIKPNTLLFNVKTAVSISEITSGTLNAMLTLADSDSAFSKKLQEYLFWLEMASLGGDLLVEKFLRQSAKNTMNSMEEALLTASKSGSKKELEKTLIHLAEMAGDFADYSSRYAKVLKKSLDKASDKIKNFELSIQKNEFEGAMLFNEAKRIELKYEGSLPGKVKWYNLPDTKLKGSTLTHNHPKSLGLSLADIKEFLRLELQEIRAIGKNGDIFSMKNIGITVEKRRILMDLIKKEEKYAKDVYHAVDLYYQEAYVFKKAWDVMKDNVEYIKFIK